MTTTKTPTKSNPDNPPAIPAISKGSPSLESVGGLTVVVTTN